jgi:hypothetical protein
MGGPALKEDSLDPQRNQFPASVSCIEEENTSNPDSDENSDCTCLK